MNFPKPPKIETSEQDRKWREAVALRLSQLVSGVSGVAWGAITGNLSNQTDLANQLAAKLETETDPVATASLNNHKTSSDHDGRYYTEAEITLLLAPKLETETDPVATAALNNHKTSSDHDGRYYTETEVDSLMNDALALAIAL